MLVLSLPSSKVIIPSQEMAGNWRCPKLVLGVGAGKTS